jgi:hypothetical protein
MRGDGQVVQVKFNSLMVEIVPAFQTTEQHTFLIPDTNDGGRWKATYPEFESALIDVDDRVLNGNVRSLCRMMKTWMRFCDVPLKSFHIELLVREFLNEYKHRQEGYFYFDWFVRDFLRHLTLRAGSTLWVPNLGYSIPLGGAWLSKAQSAHHSAVQACDFEYRDLTVDAGLQWQRIFGSMISLVP